MHGTVVEDGGPGPRMTMGQQSHKVPHLGCRDGRCFLTGPRYATQGVSDTLTVGTVSTGGGPGLYLERLETLLVEFQ